MIFRCSTLALLSAATTALATASIAEAQSSKEHAAPLSSDSLVDIVVTARKIAENSQDVPISIQAFSAEALKSRQITNAFDLQNHISGLVVSGPTGNFGGRTTPSFAIRGQSASSMAEYFGGVIVPSDSQGRTNGMLGRNLWDLESVQIAKGPQGTQTGRNSTGGAIYFAPQRPQEDFGGFVTARYDNLDKYDVQAVLNLPIVSEKVLWRVGGERAHGPGFTKNLTPGGKDFDNTDYWLLRTSLIIRPNDAIENYTLVSFYHANEAAAGFVLAGVTAGCAAGSKLLACLYPSVIPQIAGPGRDIRETYGVPGFDATTYEQSLLVTNTTTFKLSDIFTIKNIAGYQHSDIVERSVQTGSSAPFQPAVFRLPRQYLSDEFQLQIKSPDQRLNAVLGGYVDKQSLFSNGHTTKDFLGQPSPLTFGGHTFLYYGTPAAFLYDTPTPKRDSTSQSLFANVSYDLSGLIDGLGISAGYRYTWQKVVNAVQAFSNGACALSPASANFNPATCTITSSARFDAPTYTAGLTYKLGRHAMIYVTQSHGYREGGFNNSVPIPSLAAFGPEKVNASEAGIKADWKIFGRPIRTNLSGHYEKYSGIQRSTTVAATNSAGMTTLAFVTQNGAKGRIYGSELEVTYLPVNGLTITAAYSYLNAKYTKYISINSFGQPVDLSGLPFNDSPKSTLSLSTTYDLPTPETWGGISVTGSYYYRSAIIFTPDGLAGSRTGSLNLFDGRVDWKNIAGSPISAALYGKNLFNKIYNINRTEIPAFGYTTELFGPPRTVGVEVTYRF